MANPITTFEQLRQYLFTYYDTPFRLRDEAVARERRELLDQEGATWREPWLEPIRAYATTGLGFEAALKAAGASPDLAAFAQQGLIKFPDIFEHQRQAVEHSIAGKNIAVTAGTGSGKTEAFLLPIVSALLEESTAWAGKRAPAEPWWTNASGPWSAHRSGEARPAAVRALILYPMNALVEDQVGRLREALDGNDAHGWLDEHRGGHRFYFGRYTGATPVSGPVGVKGATERLRRTLKLSDARAAKARELDADDLAAGRPDKRRRFYLPRTDGAEMRSRWDMQHSPPDVLITNYSMLNIMLLRDLDRPILDRTRAWLAKSVDHVFHIVVDELHMYRGTSGTEVAYLLRNLLHHLGLSPNSPQVRFIATSASLGEKEQSRLFLADFFGDTPDSFEVIEGAPRKVVREDPDLSRWSHDFAEAARRDALDPDAAATLLADSRVADAMVAAADAASAGSALALSHLDRLLFPSAQSGEDQPVAISAELAGLIASVCAAEQRDPRADRSMIPRLRTHLFFRNISGIWACSDPACNQVPDEYASVDRRVGRLYRQPRNRCECGARVLELMYCQTCGDLFLGGFMTPEREPGDIFQQRHLLSDVAELGNVPDRTTARPNALNYTVYWPRTDAVKVKPWTRDDRGYTFAFKEAEYDPSSGRLTQKKLGQTGWLFTVETSADAKPEQLPPLPIKCPQCGTNWEMRATGDNKLAVEDAGRTRSPIRSMGTGYEKIVQVLLDRLVRSLADGSETPEGQLTRRKLVLFSDSRQDAAKLSAGIEKRHYQDVVRQLLAQRIGDSPLAEQIEAARRVLDRRGSSHDVELYTLLNAARPDIIVAMNNALLGLPGAEEALETALRGALVAKSISALALEVESDLIALGMNPAGPDPSTSQQPPWGGKNKAHWTELYSWTADPPSRKAAPTTSNEVTLRSRIDNEVERQCALNVFSGTGRDFESIGLAVPTIELQPHGTELDGDLVRDVTLGSVRILGDSRRIEGIRGSTKVRPGVLGKYWAAVAALHRIDAAALEKAVTTAWSNGVVDHLIRPRELRLVPARESQWVCTTCHRRHLHPAGGVCTACGGALPTSPEPVSDAEDDYYRFLATRGDQPFRMHSEELTGQTDSQDGPARQARFQEVFLGDEIPRVDGIDVLSVTTTMEAGVDIGSLQGVAMSNMPPQRFNYQQRVGRAGRSTDAMSFALTVCRPRTHDEYYFNEPQRITNDPPPKPYIDLGRPEVLRRVLAAECLSQAFNALQERDPDVELGTNVHGQFGSVGRWPYHRAGVQTWLEGRRDRTREVCTALLSGAPEEMQQRIEEFVDFAAHDLVERIDKITEIPAASPDLSQHLAEHGVLPMFGFPTRVRRLYMRPPLDPWPWPPRSVTDRQLDLAIVDFAPGAETVKDKQVHTAVGIAEYHPAGNIVKSIPRPLEPTIDISMCRRCLTVRRDALPADSCDVCGAHAPEFSVFPLSEPAGFRTDFRPVDFEGSFSPRTRATSPRIVPDIDKMERHEVEGAISHYGRSSIFVVNDNAGRLFRFAPEQATGTSWYSVNLWDDPAQRSKLRLPESLELDLQWEGALGLTKETDALLLGLRDTKPRGLDLMPWDPARRGAWYSFGFLLRAAASRLLDIGTGELDVGYSVRLTADGEVTEAFLADSLENGAGYATHLGSPDGLDQLFDSTRAFVADRLLASTHACDSSCPDCLRDWSNLIYHPILDWRLATDLFNLMCGDALDLAQWTRSERLSANAFAEDFNGECIELDGGVSAIQLDRGIVIVTHPFEAQYSGRDSELTDRQDDARVDAESRVADGDGTIVYCDSFDLERRPSWVWQQVQSQL